MSALRMAVPVFAMIWLLCSGPELSAAQVMVFAAASLTEALREAAQEYQKTGTNRIRLNFAGSSTLARQIEEGAPADLFFSADEAQMERLARKGLVVAATRTNVLANSLVIVVPSEGGASIKGPEDLANPVIHRIALGDPKAVPIGIYARAFLEQAGLWERVAPKIVPTENVRAALAAVESGNADASIVYKTDALITKKVRIAYVVPAGATKIRYPAALVRAGPNPKAAALFLKFLTSPSAIAIFEKHGLIALPSS